MLDGPGHERRDHFLLGAEVEVQGAARDARALGDVADGHGLVTLVGQQGLAGVEDGPLSDVTLALGGAAAACGGMAGHQS